MVVAMIFIFGSMKYNNSIIERKGAVPINQFIELALIILIIFAVVFITYTNLSFLKYRQREFGLYFTLGMTSNNIVKLIFVENILIFVISLLTGLSTGILFSRLYYLGLNKILPIKYIVYELNFESVFLSIAIFGIINFLNFLFNIIYLKKSPVVINLKGNRVKDKNFFGIVLGTISLVFMIVSMHLVKKIFMNEIFQSNDVAMTIIFVSVFIFPYFIIGTYLLIVKKVFKLNKSLYNNNVLVLSNMVYKLFSYKNIIFIAFLLISVSFVFSSYQYYNYSACEKLNDSANNYEIKFVEKGIMNNIDKSEVKKVLDNNGGEIEEYSVLECLNLYSFRKYEDSFELWSECEKVVSESNFNNHINTNYDILEDELLYVSNTEIDERYDIEDLIAVTKLNNRFSEFENYNFTMDEDILFKNLKNTTGLNIENSKIKTIEEPFSNSTGYYNLVIHKIYVVDDKVYNNLKNNIDETRIEKYHLLKGKFGNKSFNALVEKLKKINGLDDGLWEKPSLNGYDREGNENDIYDTNIENFRPMLKSETLNLMIESLGVGLFVLLFLSILFIVSEGIIIYYKVLSNITDDMERIISLRRIGMTLKEFKILISKELAVLFFTPVLLGCGIGFYFLYLLDSISEMLLGFIPLVIKMIFIYFFIQLFVFFVTRNKYIKEIKKIVI
jgi:ABC-type antimicrobial peptide transport system permease subunit